MERANREDVVPEDRLTANFPRDVAFHGQMNITGVDDLSSELRLHPVFDELHVNVVGDLA